VLFFKTPYFARYLLYLPNLNLSRENLLFLNQKDIFGFLNKKCAIDLTFSARYGKNEEKEKYHKESLL